MSNAHTTKLVGAVLASIPLMGMYSKHLRLHARDEAELLFEASYRTGFWKRGTEFSRTVTGHIHDSVLGERAHHEASVH